MSRYANIREIKVIDDPNDVNELLRDWWELLEIYKGEDGIVFILGRNHYNSIQEFLDCYGSEGTV